MKLQVKSEIRNAMMQPPRTGLSPLRCLSRVGAMHETLVNPSPASEADANAG
ncbi:hypothetical protein OH492_13965 [Vibrio chagasii]|nr:hypothetical protein [Vibrio chagasii]